MTATGAGLADVGFGAVDGCEWADDGGFDGGGVAGRAAVDAAAGAVCGAAAVAEGAGGVGATSGAAVAGWTGLIG